MLRPDLAVKVRYRRVVTGRGRFDKGLVKGDQ